MSDDILRATIRKTPGHARISLWVASLAITAAFGALVIDQLDGVARIVFGSLTAMLFLWIVSWLFSLLKFNRRLSALVSQAITTGQSIHAKPIRPSSFVYEVWVGEHQENKIRMTLWFIGVLRTIPGVELIQQD